MKQPKQRTARPATAAQIAMYGHVAARLRAALEKSQMTPSDFNRALGLERGHASIYNWLNAKAGIGAKRRPGVAKLLGIPEQDLLPRSSIVSASSASIPVKAVVGAPVSPTLRRSAEVLSFSISDRGEARIKLDVTLPLTSATPLLRMLLDAGLVLGSAQEVNSDSTE